MRHLPTQAAVASLTLTCVVGAGLALGGCGGGRVVDPSLAATALPNGFTEVSYPAAGVKLSIPRDWTPTPEKAPMVAVFSSGPAVMSLWRFDSTHSALTQPAQLRGALAALLRVIRAQEPSLQVQATGLSRVGGDGAVLIDATERVNGRLRRVRTEHIYIDHAELVLDAYAPVDQFSSVDHAVFSPTRKSLALTGAANTPTPSAATTGTATTGTATTGTTAPGLTAPGPTATGTATTSPGAGG